MAEPGHALSTPQAEIILASPYSALRSWARQELLLLFREPAAVFFSLAFPLIIFAFIGTTYATEEIRPGIKLIDVIFPTLLGTVAANLCVMGMPIYLSELRSGEVLRKYKTMPMPGWILPTAIVGSLLVLFAVSSVILAAVVGATYGVRPSLLSPRFLVLTILLLAWLSCLGFFLGTLPGKVRTVQTASAAAFFVMFFGSGAAAPIDGLPTALEYLTRANPLRHWFDGMIDAYLGDPATMDSFLKMATVTPFVVLFVVIGKRNLRRESN